ncbi:MAG: hypothetical protein ACRD29_04610 [Acidimicrobiales bacterium]
MAGLLGLVTGLVQSFTGLEPITTSMLFPMASLAFTIVLVIAGITLWRKADELSRHSIETGRVEGVHVHPAG